MKGMEALADRTVRSRKRSESRFTCLRLLPFWLSAGLALVFLPSAAWTAQQGTGGLTSSGSTDIVYVQGLNVRINGFADLDLGTWSGSGPLTADDDLCVGRSGVGIFSFGPYRILASGDGAPGNPAAFTLSNGFNQLHYNAFFNDQAGTAGRTQLSPGVQLTGQSGFGLAFFFNMILNCAVQNANISIEVPETELSGGAGIYTGTLTLTMIPE